MALIKKVLYWLVVVLLIGVSLGNQMTFILPMALVVYHFRAGLSNFLKRFSLPVAFVGSGLFFGLLTESFAVWSNLKLPLEARALLSPYPQVDLTLGIFWYGLFTVLWYFMFKKYHYNKKEIFLLCGLYGLIFEQGGKFFILLFSPLFLLPLFIMMVYAIFPLLAYMITRERFTEQKATPWYKRYVFGLLLLAIHALVWKLAGFIYYPILQKLGYLEYLKK